MLSSKKIGDRITGQQERIWWSMDADDGQSQQKKSMNNTYDVLVNSQSVVVARWHGRRFFTRVDVVIWLTWLDDWKTQGIISDG